MFSLYKHRTLFKKYNVSYNRVKTSRQQSESNYSASFSISSEKCVLKYVYITIFSILQKSDFENKIWGIFILKTSYFYTNNRVACFIFSPPTSTFLETHQHFQIKFFCKNKLLLPHLAHLMIVLKLV